MRETVFEIARRNLGGRMESSARLCLEDAMRLRNEGNLALAERRALKSISYSVGILHDSYAKAWKLVKGNVPVTSSI